MNKVGKYEFASKQEALEAIKSLGVSTDEETNQEYPTHKHSVVDLGNIVLTQGEYDEEGNEVEDASHRLNLEAESLRNKAMLHILQQGVSVDKQGEKVYLQDVYNQDEEVREEE